MHAKSLGLLLRKDPDDSVVVHFRAMFAGLAGRVLRSWANPLNDLLVQGRSARSDEAVLETRLPVDAIEERLAEFLTPLLASLYDRFGVAGPLAQPRRSRGAAPAQQRCRQRTRASSFIMRTIQGRSSAVTGHHRTGLHDNAQRIPGRHHCPLGSWSRNRPRRWWVHRHRNRRPSGPQPRCGRPSCGVGDEKAAWRPQKDLSVPTTQRS